MLRRNLGGSGHTIFRETPGWAANSPANRLEILSPASSSGWVLASVQSAAAFVTFPWQPGGRAGWTYCQQQQPAALLAGRLGDTLKERQTGTREGADDRGTSGRASHMPSRVFTRATPTCATQGLHRDKQGLQMTLWNPTGAHVDPTQAGLLSGYRQPLTMDPGAAHPHCLGTWNCMCGSPPRPTESETWGWARPPAFNKPPAASRGRLLGLRTSASCSNTGLVALVTRGWLSVLHGNWVKFPTNRTGLELLRVSLHPVVVKEAKNNQSSVKWPHFPIWLPKPRVSSVSTTCFRLQFVL